MIEQSLPPLAFIGGGNITRALLGGLAAGASRAPLVWAADPSEDQRGYLEQQFPGVKTSGDNSVAAGECRVWILAVKPQRMREVALALAPLAGRCRPLVVSVAAGIRAADLGRWLGPGAIVVRAMPNRPALVRSASRRCTRTATSTGSGGRPPEAIMAAVGRVVWVKSDADIDVVTAVSGSGPAYFLRLMELIEEAEP